MTRGFYQELNGGFARWQKKGRNNEVTVLPRYLIAGFQCNAIFFFFVVSREASASLPCLKNTHNYNVSDGRSDPFLAAGEMTHFQSYEA